MARQSELLSFGVLLVIVALVLVLFVGGEITDFGGIIALIITFYGIWTIILGGIRLRNPEKYGRGVFSTMAIGVFFVAVGGAWALSKVTGNVLLAIVLLILVIGVLAVISALPSMRKE
jgi:hypothetical protein